MLHTCHMEVETGSSSTLNTCHMEVETDSSSMLHTYHMEVETGSSSLLHTYHMEVETGSSSVLHSLRFDKCFAQSNRNNSSNVIQRIARCFTSLSYDVENIQLHFVV